MKVLKFGGTSIKEAALIKNVVNIVGQDKEPVVLVLSAFATVTDALVELSDLCVSHHEERVAKVFHTVRAFHLKIARELELKPASLDIIETTLDKLKRLISALAVLGDATPRSRAIIMSFGEDLSRTIVHAYFVSQGLNAGVIDPREFMITDGEFLNANLDLKATKAAMMQHLEPLLRDHSVVVTSGFIAADGAHDTTTLGRGGSDYTAAVIASVMHASALEIWTDVMGIMSCDPRVVKGVLPIEELTYAEAAELAFFGAKVLHPKTIRPAVKNRIPVFIKNSYEPSFSGTRVGTLSEPEQRVKAIAFQRGITVINMESAQMLGAFGFLSRIFDIFTKNRLSVDLVTTSEVNVSVTVEGGQDLGGVMRELSEFCEVTVEAGMALISVIGEGLKNTAGISARFFGALKGINVSMVSVGASEVNLSIVVEERHMERAVQLLHDEFFAAAPAREVSQ